MPIPASAGLPSNIVSQAELQAVNNFERLMSASAELDDNGLDTSPDPTEKTRAATGQAFKQLRKMLKEQCKDEFLIHCHMKKARAKDGTIEFVSEGSRERFMAEGAKCLIWNNLPDVSAKEIADEKDNEATMFGRAADQAEAALSAEDAEDTMDTVTRRLSAIL